ncbi:MAG TPA: tRNA epoxyqueuosine(34) reductase QueG [Thermomicrobiales bacterium]|nr:tRNA epoxyqueuosine(34) reductase QueG [Thermomicrobiales bacterium]
MNTSLSKLTIHPPEQTARQQLTARVKLLAARNGLSVNAVTTADPFTELAEHLENHIAAGHVEGMDWFTAERARESTDVRNLHPTAKSIISFGLAYWSGPAHKPDDGIIRGRISRYAWGRDYHRVLKRRMKSLCADMQAELGCELDVRILVDTARIVDRAVAARAGLGWYGKSANLIVPGHGTWVLLGEMVTELDLEPDKPLSRNCGNCTICIDNCPTGAIVGPYTIHAPSCISYLTIELREAIPYDLRPKMQDWVYGCDVCQDVCPYTGAAKKVDEPELQPTTVNNAFPSLHWLLEMTQEEFGETYFGTPVPRTKRRGLARNAAVALGNIGSDDDVSVLIRALTSHDEAVVRGHAAWALGRIAGKDALAALDRSWTADSDASVREECEWSLDRVGTE